jgi:hypothetical protein
VKPYFYTCLFISFVGSILNTLLWILDDVLMDNFEKDLPFTSPSFYMVVLIVSSVLSIICSYVVILILWIFETRKGNRFIPIIHILLFVLSIITLLLIDLMKEGILPFLGCYYLPGVVGYYLFVHRSRKKGESEIELLDRD